MKRLKTFLLAMEPNTTTYKAMYEGNMVISDPRYPTMDPYTDYSANYFSEDIGFEILTTHKLAQDKPTVLISIPCARLGIDVPTHETELAEADFCLRAFHKYVDALNAELYNRSRPDNENGKYYLSLPGGEVLHRNTAYFALRPQKDYENGNGCRVYLLNDGIQRPPIPCLCLRIMVQLPKRRLRKVVQMLCRDLPDAVEHFINNFDHAMLKETRELAKRQVAIRQWLQGSEYTAFIANGSILPREKGSDLPLKNAIPFLSPPNDEIEIFGIRGMGIKKGVTVITGGGYSGKSTLLDAISGGIYDHVIGDGRELCITDDSAFTISAEDGRSVRHVNISPFIKWLPSGDTADFSTDHASGSTSQAANIMEAVDAGAKLLLIDEDRSATNFMIRDRMMKELIAKEPITPFTDRALELCRERGVSTVLVIGGSGEYLSVADKIYMMNDYKICDVTEKAKEICNFYQVVPEVIPSANWEQSRVLYSDRFSSYPEGSGSELLSVSDMGFILIGDEKIDLRGLHDIVSKNQITSLAFILRYLEISNTDRKVDLEKKINDLYAKIYAEGIDFLYSSAFTSCERFLDLPRKIELKALINRMRKIHLEKGV